MSQSKTKHQVRRSEKENYPLKSDKRKNCGLHTNSYLDSVIKYSKREEIWNFFLGGTRRGKRNKTHTMKVIKPSEYKNKIVNRKYNVFRLI